uniref:CARD domain-containing protein n=1 Tax=Oryzias melastigma TaxID=30732 RepID=A0A3B3BET0_ORYME
MYNINRTLGAFIGNSVKLWKITLETNGKTITFINKLLDREGDPRVSEEQVKGRGHPEVVEVMVNVFSEENLLNVAAEVLHDARLVKYEVKKHKYAPAGVSAAPGKSEQDVLFLRSTVLIGNVPDPDPLLDLLRHKKVLSDHSYSEIKALPTDDRKMSQLLMGPYLKTKPSCDIFYDYLKKEHPYLVLDLLQN